MGMRSLSYEGVLRSWSRINWGLGTCNKSDPLWKKSCNWRSKGEGVTECILRARGLSREPQLWRVLGLSSSHSSSIICIIKSIYPSFTIASRARWLSERREDGDGARGEKIWRWKMNNEEFDNSPQLQDKSMILKAPRIYIYLLSMIEPVQHVCRGIWLARFLVE